MFGLVALECNASLDGRLGGGEDEDRATDFLLGEVTGVNPSESVRTRSEDLDRRVRPRVGSRNLDCPPIDPVSMAKSRATLARPPLLDLVFFFCLQKILIFSKASIFKAFIEFSNLKEAEQAKRNLHDKVLLQLGHARLYYSPQQKLSLSNKFVEFWENENEKQESDQLTQDSSLNIFKKSEKDLEFGNKQALSDQKLRNSIVDNISLSGKAKSEEFALRMAKSSISGKKKLRLVKGSEFLKKAQISDLISKEEEIIEEQQEDDIPEIKNYMPVSRVVLVSNLDNIFSDAQEVFNLFSNFGDITALILMHNHQKALIEYKSFEASKTSIINISNTKINNTKLKVNYSKYQQIDINKSCKNEVSLQYNEVMTVPNRNNRFISGQQNSVKAASSELLFEIERKSDIKMIDVYFFVEKFAEPESIKTLEESTKDLLKVVLTFKDKATAIRVISKFHRCEIKTNRVNVSFY